MRADFHCETCTGAMERVNEFAWMCVRCRINEYWPDVAEPDVAAMLQREWEADPARNREVS